MKYAPIAIFSVLLASLLIGQRFGFVWAGGSGYDPETGAYDASGTYYDRGETVSTAEQDRTYLRVGTPGDIAMLAELWLDHDTEIILDQTNSKRVTVRIIRGRVFAVAHDAQHPFTITTNAVQSTIFGGSLSVVNYDFRETVSVIPINTTALVLVKNAEVFETEKPVDIHETSPVSILDTTFDPSSGAAADFYAWAIE
ncbi:hypothetical protein A2348_02675 [Candidatus Uhrbacteria bacterium RIFOXYB12_FULL_58_10]|uniref:FecR protein domain-containing protein n=1 Tax=Candidatus Uhrbacteria bacterium RIFOXYB2_FULL_57_15 TaxID=1802422 RepID=A0A1F7W8S0_9BACT|nr:MAG: hypothetical protein A2348_02675 [Candidatus Uhrbacteria bacterium RIFOXYB12_FULL_58_10]OGL98484.1 MAG: hypothetical protein A2304_02215 [Candidatus Uhrbacteria bacterium RIFOXYB2_FULL_57_15]